MFSDDMDVDVGNTKDQPKIPATNKFQDTRLYIEVSCFLIHQQ